MNNEELLLLIERIANNTASDEDIRVYNAWCNSFQEKGEAIPDFSGIQSQMLLNINREIDQKPTRTFYPFYRIAAAASVLLFLSIGGYFLLHKQPIQHVAQNQVHDIAPGGNKAILTLAGGKQIVLTGAKNGTIAKEHQITINKTADGQLVYDVTGQQTAGSKLPTDNLLSTPRGGQYHLTLADGTQVWLNSASSLKYPSAFTGKERRVELTGEAYFEVVHNSAMPFRVVAAGETVEDLGTHFNINAYTDEPAIKTTLLEGSVKVSVPNSSSPLEKAGLRLKPGQETILKDQHLSEQAGDMEMATAWKNGLFAFYNTPLPDVMRQLSRWYDVNITFEGRIPDREFSGKLYRNVKASQVLDILAYKKVHYRIEQGDASGKGKKIVIMP